MNMDTNWWGNLFTTLALEAASISLLAWLGMRFTKHPQFQRLILRTTIATWICLWGAEFVGIRAVMPQPAHPLQMPRDLSPTSAKTILSAPQPQSIQPVGIKAESRDDESAHWSSQNSEPVSSMPIRSLIQDSTVLSIPRSRSVYWPAWIWLVGMLALITRMATGHYLSYIRYSGLGVRRVSAILNPNDLALVRRLESLLGLRNVRVRVGGNCKSPLVFGILQPTIVLPLNFADTFSAPQREAIVAHELAHLASHDPLWLLAADLLVAVAWWHPAGYWLRRRLRACSEISADQASHLVPNGSVALSEALVVLGKQLTSARRRFGLDVAGSGLKSDLAFRIGALLNEPVAAAVGPIWRMFVSTAAVASIVGLASAPMPMADTVSPAELLARNIANRLSSNLKSASKWNGVTNLDISAIGTTRLIYNERWVTPTSLVVTNSVDPQFVNNLGPAGFNGVFANTRMSFDSESWPLFYRPRNKAEFDVEKELQALVSASKDADAAKDANGPHPEKLLLNCSYIRITDKLLESSGLARLLPRIDAKLLAHSQSVIQASNSPIGRPITNYSIGGSTNYWTEQWRLVSAYQYAKLRPLLNSNGVIERLNVPRMELQECDSGTAWFQDAVSQVNRATIERIPGTKFVRYKPFPVPRYRPGVQLSVQATSPIGTAPVLALTARSMKIEKMAAQGATISNPDSDTYLRSRIAFAYGHCGIGEAIIIALPEEENPDEPPESAPSPAREFVIAEVTEITN